MAIKTYVQAIREAHAQVMECDESVFIFGQGLWSPWYAGESLKDLDKEFGRDRVIDSNVSENAVTGAGVGAALSGMRPVIFHPRMDFALLALDPLINQAANWSYLFSGSIPVPMVVRTVINRGGEQGAQHSQALHAIFAHIPGIKVVMPSSPYDAKGLFVSSVRDNNPVIYIDDRWLYEIEEEVPDDMYEVKIGTADIKKSGEDITIISNSYMTELALLASNRLSSIGVDAEIVDLRTIKPLDAPTIVNSVRKTGAILVLDGGWKSFGISSEIISIVVESSIAHLKFVPGRVTLPDAPAPTSRVLEECYYPTTEVIVQKVKSILEKKIERNYEV